jgi:hypothetical protein
MVGGRERVKYVLNLRTLGSYLISLLQLLGGFYSTVYNGSIG